MNRELLLELKEFLTERMVDNMSTKDLEEYVANDLLQSGKSEAYPSSSGWRLSNEESPNDRSSNPATH